MAPVMTLSIGRRPSRSAGWHEVRAVYYSARTDRSVENRGARLGAMLSGGARVAAVVIAGVVTAASAAGSRRRSRCRIELRGRRGPRAGGLPRRPAGHAASRIRSLQPARRTVRAARCGGEVVRFVAGDPRADIFTDPQVRDREVEVRGWRRPGEAIEILSVYAVKDGALHHLHYRCDVCNITTYAPGPCWCCGAPFELREGPAGGDEPDPGQ